MRSTTTSFASPFSMNTSGGSSSGPLVPKLLIEEEQADLIGVTPHPPATPPQLHRRGALTTSAAVHPFDMLQLPPIASPAGAHKSFTSVMPVAPGATHPAAANVVSSPPASSPKPSPTADKLTPTHQRAATPPHLAPLTHPKKEALAAFTSSALSSLLLPPAAIHALVDCSKQHSYTRGEYLFKFGDLADSIFLLATTADAAPAQVSLEAIGGASAPTSPSMRRASIRGSVSPPIATSAFLTARRRASNPLPLPQVQPQPLSSIRENPVGSIAVKSNLDSFEAAPAICPEENKPPMTRSPTSLAHAPRSRSFTMGSNELAQHASMLVPAILTGTSEAPDVTVASLTGTASTGDALSPTSPTAPSILRSAGDLLGCEGLSTYVKSAPSTDYSRPLTPPASLRRTYSARVVSERVDAYVVSYADFRSRFWPLLSQSATATNMLGEALVKHLMHKEMENIPVKAPVPTLASITAAQAALEEQGERPLSPSLGTAASGSGTTLSTPPPHSRSLSTAACKYTDLDLLLHPLFQKVFYVFCQQEATHELLEFWRDCVNFRQGTNKQQLSLEEEAKILHKAYILPSAKKYQRLLPLPIQDTITKAVKEHQAHPETASFTRFLFLDGELHIESLLTSGSLRSFKQTSAFLKILPFVKLDPKQRKKNEEARRSLTGMLPAGAAEHLNGTASPASSPSTPDRTVLAYSTASTASPTPSTPNSSSTTPSPISSPPRIARSVLLPPIRQAPC